MLDAYPVDPVRHGGAGLRTFLNIAELWSLSDEEQMQILGVHDPAIFKDCKARVQTGDAITIPIEVITRIGCVLSIFASLVTLVSSERSASWIRGPHQDQVFGGRSPLTMMTSGSLDDLDSVARYLLGRIHG